MPPQVPRLIYVSTFKPYFYDKQISAPAVNEMIKANVNFQLLREATDRVTEFDCERAVR